jgi:hypothetical protein
VHLEKESRLPKEAVSKPMWWNILPNPMAFPNISLKREKRFRYLMLALNSVR